MSFMSPCYFSGSPGLSQKLRLWFGDVEGDFEGADFVGDGVEHADAERERAGVERDLLVEDEGRLEEVLDWAGVSVLTTLWLWLPRNLPLRS
jgi:hypothetical protein